MERLTKRLSSGASAYNYPASCYFDDNSGPDRIAQSAFRQRCVERLAEYEETGLEPAMCANYKTFEDEAISKGVPFKRIVALMEADRDGRLVVRPYSIGETVYVLLKDGAIFYPETNGWYISKEVIGAISPDGFYLGDPVDDVYTPDSEIGKTVFLTQKAAKAALEVKRDGSTSM